MFLKILEEIIGIDAVSYLNVKQIKQNAQSNNFGSIDHIFRVVYKVASTKLNH
jgi:hypothetical protein